jgi:protocatechuate 3,4-dioxygenase beta subunit
MEYWKDYEARDFDSHPPYVYPDYKSTTYRGPTKPLVKLEQSLSEITGPGPSYGANALGPLDADLTKNAAKNGDPLGERIIVTGTVSDGDGTPVPNALVEIWQANAAGRYVHERDQHPAPLDPNFLGSGRCVTDEKGRYRFLSIKPGAYPWGNHENAWRPNHIHFSVFGPSIATRLVTQMYFPGDPLLEIDPIFLGTPEHARDRLISTFSEEVTEPEWALGYVFDIVLRGPNATPAEK